MVPHAPSDADVSIASDVSAVPNEMLVKPPRIGPLNTFQFDQLENVASEPAVSIFEFDPASVTIELWAEMSAEIDKGAITRIDVLEAREMTTADFTSVEKHWKAMLEQEATHLGFALRFKYDAAYVGKLENLRNKELTASEYGRIAGAGGYQQVALVLRELEMPPEAHLPIVRQWTMKLARNPKLSAEMMQSMMAARDSSSKPFEHS
jgi:hypothetical protein